MKQETSRLERLQRRFWEFIVAPRGVTEAMAQIAEQDPESVPLQNWIQATDEDMAITRLDVYANMYFFRLVGVLQDQYEALNYVLGVDTFISMCADFLQYYPPSDFSLDFVGDALPAFLKQFCPPDQPPWLHQLAELEQARYKLLSAPDTEPLLAESLQQIPPDQWGEIRFQPVNAFRLLEFAYPVHQAWRAKQDQTEVPTLEPEPTMIAVWRHEFSVIHQVVAPEEKPAYSMLLAGEPFEDICFSFLPDDDDDDDEDIDPEILQASVQSAYQLLSNWVQQGMLRKLQ